MTLPQMKLTTKKRASSLDISAYNPSEISSNTSEFETIWRNTTYTTQFSKYRTVDADDVTVTHNGLNGKLKLYSRSTCAKAQKTPRGQ